MPLLNVDENEGQMLLNILGTTKEWPWTVTNPLIMKIGQQLRQQQQKGSGDVLDSRQGASRPNSGDSLHS